MYMLITNKAVLSVSPNYVSTGILLVQEYSNSRTTSTYHDIIQIYVIFIMKESELRFFKHLFPLKLYSLYKLSEFQ